MRVHSSFLHTFRILILARRNCWQLVFAWCSWLSTSNKIWNNCKLSFSTKVRAIIAFHFSMLVCYTNINDKCKTAEEGRSARPEQLIVHGLEWITVTALLPSCMTYIPRWKAPIQLISMQRFFERVVFVPLFQMTLSGHCGWGGRIELIYDGITIPARTPPVTGHASMSAWWVS